MMTKKLVSLLLALAMALSMAACSPAQTETTPVPAVETPEPVAEEPQGEAPQPEEGTVLEADVLVIGCGLSGLTSSLAAAQNGASVITLEKMAFAGGNAILSTGILQAAGSSLQAKGRDRGLPGEISGGYALRRRGEEGPRSDGTRCGPLGQHH